MGLPIAARRAAIDLLHAPAYTAPVGIRTPVVVTIHDVSYERHPEWYPYRRDRLRRAFYRASARSARGCVTDSAFSAAEIHAAYGIALDRIAVVPLGVVPRFAAGEPDAADVPSPFVLHVGDLHARRNLTVVLDAVIALRRRGGAGRRPHPGAGRRRSRPGADLHAAPPPPARPRRWRCWAS